MLSGDRQALAKLFSLIEREADQIPNLMKSIQPHTGSAYCIGVTGPPGAGKSTLVDALIHVLRRDGDTVGVVAVDPTSQFKGGAVLGDRIRMNRHYLDDGVFIRSLATRGAHGGLSRAARAVIRLLDAFGKDVVILESVGVGQTELDIINVADTVVVVLVPDAGDSIQMLKAGLIEIADIFVVNKADRSGAGRLAKALGVEIRSRPSGGWWTPPVLRTQAYRSQGIEELYRAVLEHRQAGESTSHLQRRRAARRREEFVETLRGFIEAKLFAIDSHDRGFGFTVARVERGEIDPYSAAVEVMRSVNLAPE